MMLRKLEMRATALMAGDGRSRRRVAKRLESFLSRSLDAIANLEAEVTEVLRRLGLHRRADEWTFRKFSSGSRFLYAFVSFVLSPRKRGYKLSKLPQPTAEDICPSLLS
ncbi:hypothetical protein AXG93_910s1000 [Marchantia polymorpha subsp. ruderalis]|uniref:Uncharacterized protein n=1 Tax=Marchantia polymorpha subsp. ruderalis TaxID=1480154 RepID=A0A176WAP7_MARPO|nr:hypothetical protein AXG93_910s1000 [Marchantia polymorpha subsp. ruderalis]